MGTARVLTATEPDEEFATMFEVSLQARRVEPGDTVEGAIARIGPAVACVSVGRKGEARIVIDAVLTGRVTSVRDVGAFVELEQGAEALAHLGADGGRAV